MLKNNGFNQVQKESILKKLPLQIESENIEILYKSILEYLENLTQKALHLGKNQSFVHLIL